MKVYLVENAPMVRERLRSRIAALPGVEVVGEAATARDALLGIAASDADAVVLDIHLDEGTGFDVLRELQRTSPAVAVYLLTNFVSETYRKAGARFGARGFFDKSRELDLLLAALAAAPAA